MIGWGLIFLFFLFVWGVPTAPLKIEEKKRAFKIPIKIEGGKKAQKKSFGGPGEKREKIKLLRINKTLAKIIYGEWRAPPEF